MQETDIQEKLRQPDGTYRVQGDELIGDLVAAFPRAAAAMLRYGLHCVGCSANSFDTIREGARLHGIPEEEIDRMIGEINQAVNKRIETIELTARAAAKVKELRAGEEGKERWPLRIAAKSNGTGGFGYEMDFDQRKEEDIELDFDGLQVLIDPESFPLLKGASIDYIDSLMGSGFKIDNPNATSG